MKALLALALAASLILLTWYEPQPDEDPPQDIDDDEEVVSETARPAPKGAQAAKV